MALLYQTRKSDWQSPLGGLFQGISAGDQLRQKMMQMRAEQNAAQASSLFTQQKEAAGLTREFYDRAIKAESPAEVEFLQGEANRAGLDIDLGPIWKQSSELHDFKMRETTRTQEAQKIKDEAEKLRLDIAAKKTAATTAAEKKILDAEERDVDARERVLNRRGKYKTSFRTSLNKMYGKAENFMSLGAIDAGDTGDPKYNEALLLGLQLIEKNGMTDQQALDYIKDSRPDLIETSAGGLSGYGEIPWSKSGGNIGGGGLQENPKGSSPPDNSPKRPTKVIENVKYELWPDGWRPAALDPNDGFGERSQSYEDTIGGAENRLFKDLPIPDPMMGRLKLGLDNFRRAGGA